MTSNLHPVFQEALAPFIPPTEEQKQEGDVQNTVDKPAKAHARNDLAAAQADMQWLDAMRRA